MNDPNVKVTVGFNLNEGEGLTICPKCSRDEMENYPIWEKEKRIKGYLIYVDGKTVKCSERHTEPFVFNKEDYKPRPLKERG